MPCCASTTLKPALRREPLGQAARELGRHVLHDQDRGLRPGRQLRHHLGERARAAGRCGDRRACRAPARQREQRLHVRAARRVARAPAAGGCSAPPHRAEHARAAARRSARWRPSLRSSSLATRSTAPSSSARIAAAVPGPRVGAHHHDRPGRLRHDVADGAEAVELGHLEVHQHQVGLVVVHLLQRVHAVPRGGHDAEVAAPVHHVASAAAGRRGCRRRPGRSAAQRCWTPCATE